MKGEVSAIDKDSHKNKLLVIMKIDDDTIKPDLKIKKNKTAPKRLITIFLCYVIDEEDLIDLRAIPATS